jgi:hypothetical protein
MKSLLGFALLVLTPLAYADSVATYTITLNVQQESANHPTATFGTGTLLPDPYTFRVHVQLRCRAPLESIGGISSVPTKHGCLFL